MFQLTAIIDSDNPNVLSEPMMVYFIHVSLGLAELMTLKNIGLGLVSTSLWFQLLIVNQTYTMYGNVYIRQTLTVDAYVCIYSYEHINMYIWCTTCLLYGGQLWSLYL